MQMILAIGAGGAIGAVLRHLSGKVALAFLGLSFPYGTLFVNIVGSLLMGVFIGLFSAQSEGISNTLRAFLTVGVLGGFTTFSAFSLDAVTLYERGEIFSAGLYVILSLVLSLGALALGLYITRSFAT